MKLRKLQLENFRNYPKYEFEFDENKDLTILLGPNGKGKTNFLEAVYILSLGKSFRTLHTEDMLMWNEEYMRCKGQIHKDSENMELEFFYSKTPKRLKNFKKNSVNLKNSEFLGNLLTVLFHPEDLNMLYLSPSLRRRYLDILLSQTDKKYLLALSNYNKVLKQRNVLLREIYKARIFKRNVEALKDDLQAWNKQLVEFGAEVGHKRMKLIEFLEERIEKIFRNISGGDEKIHIEYHSKILKSPLQKPEIEELAKMFEDELFNRAERDICQNKTTAGPHRDDIKFFINGREISISASRGEFRTLLLAVKLAEIEYIKEKTGKKPILLLDDVFSELDEDRQTHLLKAIQNCQTIISTTDINSLKKLHKGPWELVEIE